MTNKLVIQGYFPHGIPSSSIQAGGRVSSPPLQPAGSSREVIPIPTNRLHLDRRPGEKLPSAVQQKMESFFKTDFSDVRVRVGPQPASIGALAFTCGTNIYFAPGRYNPHTPSGQQLLGHELTHVMQQRSGRVQAARVQGMAVVRDRALEAEADRLGRQAAFFQMQPSSSFGVGRGVDRHSSFVQKQDEEEEPAPFRRTDPTREPIRRGKNSSASASGTQEIEKIRNHVDGLGLATSRSDCLNVSTSLAKTLIAAPMEGQTAVKVVKYAWWRGKGTDKGAPLRTKDNKQEILTAQSHAAVKVTMGSRAYIVDVTIGQFMSPKVKRIFVGTVDEWERELMQFTDGHEGTLDRNALMADGFEALAQPKASVEDDRFIDHATAYKYNQVPGQQTYIDRKTGKAGQRPGAREDKKGWLGKLKPSRK